MTVFSGKKERRKEKRIETVGPVSLALHGEAQEAFLKNISRNGLCCVTRMMIPEMTQVVMDIRLPALPEDEEDNYHLKCQGVVVRCESVVKTNSRRKWDIGVFFTELDSQATELLDSYIKQRLKSDTDF